LCLVNELPKKLKVTVSGSYFKAAMFWQFHDIFEAEHKREELRVD